MPRTRIKICGIIRPEDAILAAELGAHAVGLNFVGGPRKITFALAAEILKRVPPIVEPVGLFQAGQLKNMSRDGEFQEIEQSIETMQWYGDAATLEPRRWGPAGAPWWIVVHVATAQALAEIHGELGRLRFRPQALILDTASADKLGGTGRSFNWNWIAAARAAGELEGLPPLILAGGLTPGNVAEAIRIARPYAVDVSSGVEVPGKPGVKDPIKVRDFIQAAQSA